MSVGRIPDGRRTTSLSTEYLILRGGAEDDFSDKWAHFPRPGSCTKANHTATAQQISHLAPEALILMIARQIASCSV